MKTFAKKFVSLAIMPAAIGGLVIGFAGIAPASAVEEPNVRPTSAAGNVGPTTTGASTTTLPWCGWYIKGLTSSITLEGDATYSGVDVPLVGSSNEGVEAFINGSGTYSGTDTNCSWYAESNKQGAQLSVGIAQGADLKFSASTNPIDNTDTSMNFDLNAANKLQITADPAVDCTANSFTVIEDASIWDGVDGRSSSNPVKSSTVQSQLLTTNKCSWTMTYSTKIPGGKSPKYGNRTYTYVGPTLVTTLEILSTTAS